MDLFSGGSTVHAYFPVPGTGVLTIKAGTAVLPDLSPESTLWVGDDAVGASSVVLYRRACSDPGIVWPSFAAIHCTGNHPANRKIVHVDSRTWAINF